MLETKFCYQLSSWQDKVLLFSTWIISIVWCLELRFLDALPLFCICQCILKESWMVFLFKLPNEKNKIWTLALVSVLLCLRNLSDRFFSRPDWSDTAENHRESSVKLQKLKGSHCEVKHQNFAIQFSDLKRAWSERLLLNWANIFLEIIYVGPPYCLCKIWVISNPMRRYGAKR